MPKYVSVSKLKSYLLNLFNLLEEANIKELEAKELPIIVYSTYKKSKKYGINISELGYTKGGFYGIKIPNDQRLVILLYDDKIKPKKGRKK